MTFHSAAFQIFAYIAFTLFVLASMGKPASAPTPQPASTPVDEEFNENLTDPWEIEYDFEPITVYSPEAESLPMAMLALPPAPSTPETEPEPTSESALALIGICLGYYDESLVVPKFYPPITTNKLTVDNHQLNVSNAQLTNYHQMNSKELRELAKIHQVKGWWNMKKSQIITELEKLT